MDMSGIWEESDVVWEDEADEVAQAVENEIRRKIAVAATEYGGTSSKSSVVPRTDRSHEEKKAKWLAGFWPLKPFNENLPLNKRKAEWVRFRNQFERIVDCKEYVGPEMQLKGMKIFAGEYLLSVIETEEKAVGATVDIYTATITRVNR